MSAERKVALTDIVSEEFVTQLTRRVHGLLLEAFVQSKTALEPRTARVDYEDAFALLSADILTKEGLIQDEGSIMHENLGFWSVRITEKGAEIARRLVGEGKYKP